MSLQNSKNLLWILLFGTIWGIIESTVGWVIHLFHIHYLTPVLILTGVLCMTVTVWKTNITIAAFYVALVTALFKMSNLFFITIQPLSWVLAPVLHILFEGLVTALIIYSLQATQLEGVKRLFIFNKRK
ncbi:MAG: hypothetical protein RRZ66_07420 [Bacteroidales bacterium]